MAPRTSPAHWARCCAHLHLRIGPAAASRATTWRVLDLTCVLPPRTLCGRREALGPKYVDFGLLLLFSPGKRLKPRENLQSRGAQKTAPGKLTLRQPGSCQTAPAPGLRDRPLDNVGSSPSTSITISLFSGRLCPWPAIFRKGSRRIRLLSKSGKLKLFIN